MRAEIIKIFFFSTFRNLCLSLYWKIRIKKKLNKIKDLIKEKEEITLYRRSIVFSSYS